MARCKDCTYCESFPIRGPLCLAPLPIVMGDQDAPEIDLPIDLDHDCPLFVVRAD